MDMNLDGESGHFFSESFPNPNHVPGNWCPKRKTVSIPNFGEKGIKVQFQLFNPLPEKNPGSEMTKGKARQAMKPIEKVVSRKNYRG